VIRGDRVSEGGSGSAPGFPISQSPSTAPSSMVEAATGSPLRWMGLLAPLPAAIYVAYQASTTGILPSALALLGFCLVVGAGVFFWGIGRSRA
jgi:hypothetical protein